MLKNLNKNKFKYLYPNMTKGFTLAEVIVAIFILTVGIIGVSALITSTISSAIHSSNKLVAAYLAQEGIEIIRNIRDTNWIQQSTNWDEGLTICSAGCEADYNISTAEDPTLTSYGSGRFLYIDGTNRFYRYIDIPGPSDAVTKFKRKITITSIDVDTLNVSAFVSWEEKGIPYTVTAKEYLYDWY